MQSAVGLSLVCVLLLAAPAAAQTKPPTPPAPPAAPSITNPMHAMPGAAYMPLDHGATQAYNQAMTKMMADMSKPYSNNADRDFVVHMIPHHQGAIDMAEVELKYGTDAKLKQLAGRIIAAQQREIGVMEAWLAKHPAAASGVPVGAK